jgi:hypothetical protein
MCRVAWIISAVVLVLLMVMLARGRQDRGPFAEWLGVEKAAVTPSFVSTLGSAGDPLVVNVIFPWSRQGYCSGQFQVHATETPSMVIVSQVQSRMPRGNVSCSGLGTVEGFVGTPLELTQPLGARSVTREIDGVPLEVKDWP